jgi:hypothetical protein
MTKPLATNSPADPDQTVEQFLETYCPRLLDQADWQRLRSDFVALILKADFEKPRKAAVFCSVLAGFLQHSLRTTPNADLDTLLTTANVLRYQRHVTSQGVTNGTPKMIKTKLETLLNLRLGLPPVGRSSSARTKSDVLTPAWFEGWWALLALAPATVRSQALHHLMCGVVAGAVGEVARSCVVAAVRDELIIKFDGMSIAAREGWQPVLSAAWLSAGPAATEDSATWAEARAWLAKQRLSLCPHVLRRTWQSDQVNRLTGSLVEALRAPGATLDVGDPGDLPPEVERIALLRGPWIEPAYAAFSTTSTVAAGSSDSLGRSQTTGGSQVAAAPRKTSRAQIRQAVKLAAAQAASPPPLVEAHAEYLGTYVPLKADPAGREACRIATVAVMERASHLKGLESFKKRCTDVGCLADWATTTGHSLTWFDLMDHALIDEYGRATGDGISARERAERVRRLKALASRVNTGLTAPALPPPIPHRTVQDPYTAAEMAAIERVTTTQPKATVARQLAAIVALSRGAGASPGDLRHVRARHVVDNGDEGLLVTLGADRPRVVPIRRHYESFMRTGLEGLRPNDLVLGAIEGRRNITSDIVGRADILGTDCPAIDVYRLRTTWLAELMTEAVPLNVLLHAADLKSARSLTDIIAWLPNPALDATVLRGRES